jgi:hypothetical protein
MSAKEALMKEVRTHPTVVVVGEVRSFIQQPASHVGQLFAGGCCTFTVDAL